MKHSPNGHSFALFNDSEYIIYRSQTFKNSGYGTGTDFCWSSNGDYAVRELSSIKLIKGNSNTQYQTWKADFQIEELYGGPIL